MFVSNTSTLILLAKISLLRDFLEIVDKILIPEEVYKEFLEKDNAFDSLLIKKEIENEKIKVIEIEKQKYKKILEQFRLHEGEAAAYSIFEIKKHKAILTDDLELIKLCKLNKVPFICSMAIVVNLYKKNKINKEKTLEKLEKLYHIGRYSKEIFYYFKKEIEGI